MKRIISLVIVSVLLLQNQIHPQTSDLQKKIDGLVAKLSNPRRGVRASAAIALGKIGPKAIPALIAALKDKDPAVRSNAAYILGRIGPIATAAIPALMITLNDKSSDVRNAAKMAIKRIKWK